MVATRTADTQRSPQLCRRKQLAAAPYWAPLKRSTRKSSFGFSRHINLICFVSVDIWRNFLLNVHPVGRTLPLNFTFIDQCRRQDDLRHLTRYWNTVYEQKSVILRSWFFCSRFIYNVLQRWCADAQTCREIAEYDTIRYDSFNVNRKAGCGRFNLAPVTKTKTKKYIQKKKRKQTPAPTKPDASPEAMNEKICGRDEFRVRRKRKRRRRYCRRWSYYLQSAN